MEKERNDWKETIREVMNSEIKENERICKDIKPGSEYYDGWQEILASLRNALEEFEKVVKEEWKPDKLQCNCKKYFANEIELYEHMKNCYT